MITNGAVDRTTYAWIADGKGRSTVKNTLAVLVRVMEQAVRDGLITTNPARIKGWQRQYQLAEDELDNPRSLALRDWDALQELSQALVAHSFDQYAGWGDVVTFAACTAARIGEVSGVRVKDIDSTSLMIARVQASWEALVERVASGVSTRAILLRRVSWGWRICRRRWPGSVCRRGSGVRGAGRDGGSRAFAVRPVRLVPVPGAGDEAELRDRHPAAADVFVLAGGAVEEGKPTGSGGLPSLALSGGGEPAARRGDEVEPGGGRVHQAVPVGEGQTVAGGRGAE
jgi:hypothetical protein